MATGSKFSLRSFALFATSARRGKMPDSDPRQCGRGSPKLRKSDRNPSPGFSLASQFRRASISADPTGATEPADALAGCRSPPPDIRSAAAMVGLRLQLHTPADAPTCGSSCELSIIAGPTVSDVSRILTIRPTLTGGASLTQMSCSTDGTNTGGLVNQIAIF